MKQIVTLIIFSLFSTLGYGQSARFDSFMLKSAKLGPIEIHVTKGTNETKPLLIYIDGSGNYPLYYQTKSGSTSTAIPLNINQYAKEYTIVLISKPGIPFKDSLSYTNSGRSYYPENEHYLKNYSLDWRAGAAVEAINFVLKKRAIDKTKIVVMGYSEGAQVAPMVAALSRKVTHVVCFVGNAQNQLYDFLLETRLSVEKKEITPDEGQKIVDSLYNEYEKIYAKPSSTTDKWYGETYYKWSSFTKITPIENMLKLSVPILYIAGGQDNHQTILDMDYAKLEFLRKGKKNLQYKVYPNCNHYFQERQIVDGKMVTKERIDEVHRFAFDWIKNNNL